MATANLSVESKDFTLPVVEATAGADGIVVSTLRNDGWVTLDPGFLTTAQCESKITYIDGKNSILRYRGYPIEQLCEQSWRTAESGAVRPVHFRHQPSHDGG